MSEQRPSAMGLRLGHGFRGTYARPQGPLPAVLGPPGGDE